MTFEQALIKASNLCARQEKCIFDIQKKLNNWQVDPHIAHQVIDRLLKEKFIDEERYIRFYVKDKFLFNHWGRIKIKWQLKAKQISGSQVDKALKLINEEEYRSVLAQLLRQKKRSLKKDDEFKTKASLVRYAASRGFEPDLIYRVLETEIMTENK